MLQLEKRVVLYKENFNIFYRFCNVKELYGPDVTLLLSLSSISGGELVLAHWNETFRVV